MHHVYILKLSNGKYYTGYSPDVLARLEDHRQGKCMSTKDKRPLKLIWFASFEEKTMALAFERYLKSGSGIAFRNKHIITK